MIRWLAIVGVLAGCDAPQPAVTPDAGIDAVDDVDDVDDVDEPDLAETGPAGVTVDCAGVDFAQVAVGTTAAAALQCSVTDPDSVGLGGVTISVDEPVVATLGEVTATAVVVMVSWTPTVAAEVLDAQLRVSWAGGVATARVTGRAPPAPTIDWDATPPDPPCAADAEAPLLDITLALAGVDRSTFTFGESDLQGSSYYAGGFLDDEFLLPWFVQARGEPHRAGCWEGRIAGLADQHLDSAHPVAGLIRHAAAWLDQSEDAPAWLAPPGIEGRAAFDAALADICETTGGECGRVSGDVHEDLAGAMAPVLHALAAGLRARYTRDASSGTRDAEFWRLHGGTGLLVGTNESYDLDDPTHRSYLGSGVAGRAGLYRAAAQIAFAVEHVDWAPFRGLEGVRFDVDTPAGIIRVRDGRNDLHPAEDRDVLFFLDLGGDDTYLGDVATNRSAANAVSVWLDLGGRDTRRYQERATPYDGPGLLPADGAGRYRGDTSFGSISLSNTFRQGGARNGIAMLFDLGTDGDRYHSLRGSQGYAHQGVGVLYDGGGDDEYLCEDACQGAAQFGIGLLVDVDGDDVYRSFSKSQGFGYVQGFGMVVDGGGNDLYQCNHGDPAQGGVRLYASPQLPADGNSSFCQGAGFGRRGGQRPEEYQSGGLGVLRDRGGDDDYEASVFAQGTGYWQGTGILSDGGGDDIFNAYWYVQAGAAHYALAILVTEGEGADSFNGARAARNVTLGAGHDYSTAVFIDEGGDDTYHITSLSAGASNCNGIGMFVDNAGADAYLAASDYGSGMGNVSGECRDARPDAASIGIMIDAGGVDRYEYPASEFPVPADGAMWGHRRFGLESEHGGGLDADGETGVHPAR